MDEPLRSTNDHDVAQWSWSAAVKRDDEGSECSSVESLPTENKEVLEKILGITWPVAASMVVSWINSFFTLFMLGRQDDVWMASYGLANVLVNITGHSLLWGLGGAFDTIASQAWGAKQYTTIGLAAQRVVLILSCVINLPVICIWLQAAPLLVGMGQSPDIADKVSGYARWRIPGLLAQTMAIVTEKALTAMNKTDVILYIDLVGVPLSMGFTWLFVAQASPASGFFTSPLTGSACAATVMDCLYGLVLTVYCACDAECRRCWGGYSRKAWEGWGAYLRLAMPACAMGIFEWWSWDIVNYLAGLTRNPKTALAANALLGQIISLAYCLSVGIQQGTQTLVGNAVGAGDTLCATRATRIGFGLGLASMLAQGLLLVTFRDSWAGLFAHEPEVNNRVSGLMPLVAGFCVIDGVQIVLSGVIIGAGKQAVTPGILVLSYWVVGLPLGAVMAFKWPQNGLAGLWWGMTLGVSLHLISYLVLCFSHEAGAPGWLGAIDWDEAVRITAERHEAEAEALDAEAASQRWGADEAQWAPQ